MAASFVLASLTIYGPKASAVQVDECAAPPTGHATINGTVVDETSSDPVFSTIFATATFAGVGPRTFSGFAGLGGSYSIQVAAPGTYVVSASPVDFVHAPEIYDGVLTNAAATTISVDDGQVVDNVDFTVVTGATLSGTVTEEDGGDPIEGVTVNATAIGDLFQFGFAQTDADGNYTIGGLAPVMFNVGFQPDQSLKNYVNEVYNDRLSSPGDPVQVSFPGVSNIDAQIGIGGLIQGTVTGPGNTPLDSVPVSALVAGGYGFGLGFTDSNGDYSIIVPTDSYKVFVSADSGFISEFYDNKPDATSADDVSVTAPQATTGIDVQLAASGKIAGRVTDADSGDPIENAFVTAYSASSDLFIAAAISDGDGAYEIDTDLATGEYKVGFEADGYVSRFYHDKRTLAAATHVSVIAPNPMSGISQGLVSCDAATTTTLGATTTTLAPPTTTTTLPVTTTVTSSTTTIPSTTTTLISTTTTTLEGGGVCGDPVALIGGAPIESGTRPLAVTASDALLVLRTAVGSASCLLCVCDVNNSGAITASDALIVLRRAVGQPVELSCPPCNG